MQAKVYNLAWGEAGDVVSYNIAFSNSGVPGPVGPVGPVGPPGTTDFNGLQNVPSVFPPDSHTHPISEVTNLQSELDSKAESEHTHTASEITDFAERVVEVSPPADWDTLTNKPDLVAVATSGDYDDLSNKPTLGTAAAQDADQDLETTDDVQFRSVTFQEDAQSSRGTITSNQQSPLVVIVDGTTALNIDFQRLISINKSLRLIEQGASLQFGPSNTLGPVNTRLALGLGSAATQAATAFAAVSHTHTPSEVGLGNVSNAAQVTSVTGTAPIVSSGGTTPAISISAATQSAAGSMSSTDKTKLDGIAAGAEVNVNADWNATTGDAEILNKPATFPPSEHTHTIDDIDTLWQRLDGIGMALDGNSMALEGKADLQHTHEIEDVTNLQDVLNMKADSVPVEDLFAALEEKADIEHTHPDATQSEAGFLSTADKTKLDGIAAGAEVNVNADWNATSGDAQILNKPTLGTAAAANTTDFAPANFVGSPVEYVIACSNETTALTAGAAKVTFRAPVAFRLLSVASSVTVAPTGSTLIVDINNGANSVLFTKLSIDATEKSSATAATAAVLNANFLFTQDAEITIDIDQVGSTVAGAGLKVILRGVRL